MYPDHTHHTVEFLLQFLQRLCCHRFLLCPFIVSYNLTFGRMYKERKCSGNFYKGLGFVSGLYEEMSTGNVVAYKTLMTRLPFIFAYGVYHLLKSKPIAKDLQCFDITTLLSGRIKPSSDKVLEIWALLQETYGFNTKFSADTLPV